MTEFVQYKKPVLSEADFEVKTRTVAADFSTGAKAIEIIKGQLGDLEIGILGNLRVLFAKHLLTMLQSSQLKMVPDTTS